MVDKNLMSIDQVSEVNDADMLYVVQNGTTDRRVSVAQLKEEIGGQIIRTPVSISPLTGPNHTNK
jgi:hypothetical protein